MVNCPECRGEGVIGRYIAHRDEYGNGGERDRPGTTCGLCGGSGEVAGSDVNEDHAERITALEKELQAQKEEIAELRRRFRLAGI